MELVLPFPTTEPRSADGTPVRHWPAGLTSPTPGCCDGECWTCWTWGAEILNGFRWMGPREGRA